MKYWARAAFVQLTIVALLYGTVEVWPISNYTKHIDKSGPSDVAQGSATIRGQGTLHGY